ncbi:hypothetical protein, partial [Ralstonia pseudosolanacearum]|uniref:hypothetical protein n=1 Tax=Ralstonia pseudosolanacearum TaxID=1310165 RepID=UPI001E350F6D
SALACSTAWPRSLALSPSASPEFQLTGVAPPSNSIYATTPFDAVDCAQLFAQDTVVQGVQSASDQRH